MLTLTEVLLNIRSGSLICTIECSIMGQTTTTEVTILQSAVTAFCNGAVWREQDVQGYLATLNPPAVVALPA